MNQLYPNREKRLQKTADLPSGVNYTETRETQEIAHEGEGEMARGINCCKAGEGHTQPGSRPGSGPGALKWST